MPEIPTFDEWFMARFGSSFDSLYQQEGMRYEDCVRALSQHGRDYLSYVATLAVRRVV